MIHLDYRDSRPIYTQISDGYRAQITAGILCRGDRLPSVRELAGRLAINPNTIQRAYRDLESEGWIVSIPGKGSFACGIPQVTPQQLQEMLEQFDALVTSLAHFGISRQALIDRLQQKEEPDHA